jgi:trk system potassium uptake protein TrkA
MSRTRRLVVAGGGRVGYRTARTFADRGHYVTVIEPNAERAAEIRGENVSVIEGDATEPDVLRQAITAETDAVAALTSDGETNLAIAVAARRVAPEGARVVARVRLDPPREFQSLVDDITLVSQSSVAAAVSALGGGAARTLREAVGDLEVHEIVVAEDAPIAGETVEEAGLPAGCLVVAAGGGDRAVGPETVLRAGASYVVAADHDVLDEVYDLFRGPRT